MSLPWTTSFFSPAWGARLLKGLQPLGGGRALLRELALLALQRP
ncbi:hypothetical protein ACGFXB_46980 [Streptomyces canus]